jgi:hypothetical protein
VSGLASYHHNFVGISDDPATTPPTVGFLPFMRKMNITEEDFVVSLQIEQKRKLDSGWLVRCVKGSWLLNWVGEWWAGGQDGYRGE